MSLGISSTFRYGGTGRRAGNASILGTIALGISLCILLGIAIAFLPWWLSIGFVLAPIVIIGGAVWPFPVLLFALALVFELVPGRVVPPLGSFRIYELVIIYLAVVVALRAFWSGESLLEPMGPFRWPLLYLLFCVIVSTAYAKFFMRNQYLLTELRGYVAWMLLPMLCYVVRDVRQRKILIAFLVVTAFAVSCYAIAQSMFDLRLLSNRVEALDAADSDVTRSITAGSVYLAGFTVFWVGNRLANGTRYAILLLIVALVCAAGIAVTFGRGVWIASAFGFLLAAWFNRGLRGMVLALVVGILAVVLVVGGFAVAKPRFAEALVDRATGVGQEIKTGGSFGGRFVEAAYAFDAIAKSPFTGVGIGGEYKRNFYVTQGFIVEARYIHDAYIGFMVKMGVQALLFPIVTIVMFFVVAFKIRPSIAPGDRAVFGAIVGTFSVPVITSLTQPEWFEGPGVAVFCSLIALLLKFVPPPVPEAQGPQRK